MYTASILVPNPTDPGMTVHTVMPVVHLYEWFACDPLCDQTGAFQEMENFEFEEFHLDSTLKGECIEE